MTAKTKLPDQTEALAFALYLASIAPDGERSAQALAVAEGIASTMTAKKVAAAKKVAEKRLEACAAEMIHEQTPRHPIWDFMRDHAQQRRDAAVKGKQ